RAVQVGLNHSADRASISRHAMKILDEGQGLFRVRGTLHIDANEVCGIQLGGFGNKGADLILRELLVDIQTHVGEFQADVGVQVPGVNVVKQLVVDGGAGAGFVGVGDIFAEIVDGDAEAGSVNFARGLEGVFDLGAGDEAAGELLTEGRALGDPAQRAVLCQRNKKSS